MNAANFDTSTADSYILSLRANNESRFSVAANGDVHAAGNYYGASAVLGTSTNPGDLAEKVDVNIGDIPESGDVMIVDPDNPDTYKISRGSYDQAVAGVISSNPTIIVGNGRTTQTAVMAMVGRVPVKVSNENGPIVRGDLLVTASTTGHAMKYDETRDDNAKMVGVIGIALENFDPGVTGTGKIMALIRTGWVYNKNQSIGTLKADVQTIASVAGIDLSKSVDGLGVGNSNGSLNYSGGNLNLNNSSLLNVASVNGKENKWEINSEGVLISRISSGDTANNKEVYGLSSTDVEVQISSSSILNGNEVAIALPEDLQNIISTSTPIKVLITFTSAPPASGYFIADKNYQGFKLKTVGDISASSTFDWLVIARRRGYDVDQTSVIPDTSTVIPNPESSGEGSPSDSSTPPVIPNGSEGSPTDTSTLPSTPTDTSTPSVDQIVVVPDTPPAQ